MNTKPTLTAIILAGGIGSRMCNGITKQRIKICGESILSRSVRAFDECEYVSSIVVVSRKEEISWAKEELIGFSKVFAIVPGGKTRLESSLRGFAAVPESVDFVAIHDAARCLITPEKVASVALAAFEHGAATAVTEITDTVKKVDSEGLIDKTLPRCSLLAAQTPQIFSRELYKKASSASINPDCITDDNMMVESLGVKIHTVNTGKSNIKITTAEDIEFAEFILERSAQMGEMRIGHGYDVHRLVKERKLILGGVEIASDLGLLGHSDADVLTHAIMDAMLGACGLGDIGRHFPDSDDRYKGISSLTLLQSVNEMIKEKKYSVVNIDATIIIQQPKIAPYIERIVSNLSEILMIEPSRINIKATTEEKLGFTGSLEGVSAHAVALLKK